jgi:hypothetical protein
LRRKAKFALAFIALGSIAAASQIGVQVADPEPGFSDPPAMAANPVDPGPAPPGATGPLAAAPVTSANSQSASRQPAPSEATGALTIKPPQQQLIAVPKKPRKAARSQNRRREPDNYDAYAWRPPRVDYGSPRGYGYFWRHGW